MFNKYISIFLFSLGVLLFFLGIPLISPGALLVLDFVPISFTQWSAWYSQSILWHILDTLRYMFGYVVASKLYFIFVFCIGIYAGMTLGQSLADMMETKKKSRFLVKATCILFLLCNPWTYERVLTQPGIALGMFCITLVIAFLIKNTLKTKETYVLLKASIAGAVALICFLHASVFLILIAVIYSIFYFKRIEKKYFLIVPIIILLLNGNWIFGDMFFPVQNMGTNSITTFDRANVEGFVGNSLSGLGTEITHLLLYGFWGERYHILTPEKFNTYWFLFGFLALGVILYGNIQLFYKNKRLWGFLSLLALISYILALGISSPLTAPVNNFLYEYVPGYIGMREPQKWLGITMICFTLFFTISIYTIKQKYSFIPPALLIFIAFTILNTWNPMNLWAYQGQLLGTTIPKEYFETPDWFQDKLQNQDKILVLPWHSYMACNWTRGKVIASMSKSIFYPLPVIVSDNLEIESKYTNSQNLISQKVEDFLQSKENSILKELNITYIIYLKNCADTTNYTFLGTSPNFNEDYTSDTVNIYSIK